MDYKDYKFFLFERKGKILTATLNRPDARNAIVHLVDNEFLKLFQEFDRDTESKVMVLTGAGKSFSAGGDVKELADGLESLDYFERGAWTGKRILQTMLDCDKPIICRMNGDAIGLGATIALFCDIVIAVETARIADPHVKVGLVAGDGGAVIWPQLIGFARAKRYLLSGDLMNAKEAEQMGLIAFAVPAEELDAKVDEWADKLANGAAKAVRLTKATINIALRQMFTSLIDVGFALEEVSTRSKDHAEAVHAFIDKRKPNFIGE